MRKISRRRRETELATKPIEAAHLATLPPAPCVHPPPPCAPESPPCAHRPPPACTVPHPVHHQCTQHLTQTSRWCRCVLMYNVCLIYIHLDGVLLPHGAHQSRRPNQVRSHRGRRNRVIPTKVVTSCSRSPKDSLNSSLSNQYGHFFRKGGVPAHFRASTGLVSF